MHLIVTQCIESFFPVVYLSWLTTCCQPVYCSNSKLYLILSLFESQPQASYTNYLSYLRKGHDKVMKLGLLCGRDDLIHADFSQVVAILNVLCDAAVKQYGLLGHDANLGTQERHVDASGVMAINQLQEVIDFSISTKQCKNQKTRNTIQLMSHQTTIWTVISLITMQRWSCPF